MILPVKPYRALWGNVFNRGIGRTFVRDVSILTVANVVTAILSFLQGILVARWLGPELYGTAALVMGYSALALTFFDARSPQASVKYLSQFQARNDGARVLAMCKLGYAVDLVVATCAFVLVCLTSHWAAHRIAHRPEVAWLMVVYAAAFIPQAIVGTSTAVCTTLARFSLLARLEVVSTVGRTVLVLGFVLAGWQVAGVVWGYAIASAAKGLLYGTVAVLLTRGAWGASPLYGKWQALNEQRRDIYRFLIYNNLSALSSMVPKQLDVVFLGYFRGPTEAGYYRLAKSLFSAVRIFLGPCRSVSYQRFSRLRGSARYADLRQSVRRYAWGAGVPLGLILLLGLPLVPLGVDLIAGAGYAPAIGAAQLLLVRAAIWCAFFWLHPLFLTLGEVKFLASKLMFIAPLTLVGYIIVIPHWGATGTAFVVLMVSLLGGPLVDLVYLRHRKQI